MTKIKSKKQPTAEQINALRLYAAENGANGANWRAKLIGDWMNSRATVGGVHSPLLQQVRNQFGPSWLASAKIDALDVARLQVTLQAAVDRVFVDPLRRG